MEAIMRVLVCGGRKFSDRDLVFATLDRVHRSQPITAIIHGGAKGADALAAEWAKARHIVPYAYPPSWTDISHPDAIIKHASSGRAYDARAGFRRNQIMLDRGRPDLVIAFPGGSGTRDMITRAKVAGVRRLEISPQHA
jgi:hypothetical protein